MKRANVVVAAVLVLVAAAGCSEPARSPDPAAPESAAAGTAPEVRLTAAQRLLDVERRPQDAATAYRAIAGDAAVPPALRARARLGEARAERLLGRTDAASALLRDVVARSADFPAIRDEAQAELTSLAGARARFAIDVIVLAEGQYLDLDTGGAFGSAATPQGGRAEIARRGDDIVWLVQHDEAPDADGAVPWIADAQWWRVTTDAGRAAWVQRLPSARPGALRSVVRLAGTAALLPAPRDAFCVGHDGAIDVRFVAGATYAKWRIERRTGTEGALEPRGEVTSPVFTDRDVRHGVRYGYRVTGITAEGDEGIPVTVQGTTSSRGVVTGSYEFTGQKDGFDFLSRQSLHGGGDLVLASAYGSGDTFGFLDPLGRVVPTAGHGVAPRTPWSAPPAVAWSRLVSVGEWITVPLRGGGVARCLVQATGNAWKPRIDYEVDPDHDAFGEGPTIEVHDDGATVEVRAVSGPDGFRVREVVVRDVLADDPPVALPLTGDRAIDAGAAAGSVREYEASASDEFGRATVRATALLDRRVATPTAGTFKFHVQQGWSFDRGATCEPSVADVVFSASGGGNSSVTLTAAGGITNLESVVGRDDGSPSAGRLLDAVHAVNPRALRLSGTAHGDERTPESDVFVLRTRHGGWARLAIVERAAQRDREKVPVTVRFTFNPRESRFSDAGSDSVEMGGMRLGPEAVPARARRMAEQSSSRNVVVDGNQRPIADGAPGGTLPPSATCQEVLLALERHRDFDMAAYSFARARREGPGATATDTIADVLYGKTGDLFEVRPGGDDGSTIEDLGVAATWDAAAAPLGDSRPAPSVVASFQHAYLVLLADVNGGEAILVRVTALVPGERVAFEWARVRDGALQTSRGFTPDAALSGTLRRAIDAATTARRGGRVVTPASAPLSAAAQATRSRLSSPGRIRIGPMPLSQSLRTFGKFEIDPAVKVRMDGAKVRFDSPHAVTFAAVLDSLTRQAGVSWTIDGAGVVQFVPPPGSR